MEGVARTRRINHPSLKIQIRLNTIIYFQLSALSRPSNTLSMSSSPVVTQETIVHTDSPTTLTVNMRCTVIVAGEKYIIDVDTVCNRRSSNFSPIYFEDEFCQARDDCTR